MDLEGGEERLRVKGTWAVLLVLILMAMLLLSGCGAKTKTVQEAGETSVPVEVEEACLGSVEVTGSFTGVLEPEMVVGVVHKMGGKVSEVKVKDGDKVKEGALLIRLDSAELSAQAAQAEAGLQLAKVNLDAAASALEDMRILYEEDIVSHQQFEQAETQYKLSEAQQAQAAAMLQLIRTQLDDTLITAPISGTTSGVTINPGEMVAPGMPVVTINKLNTMEVHVELTEKDVGRVAQGQKVSVFVSAADPDPLEGEIILISPVADPRTKTFRMKVALPNESGHLKAGMTAVIELIIAEEKDTLVIPVEAVLTQQGRQVVYVIDGDLAQSRPVTLGLENGTLVSVLEGVSPGEQVVVSGQHYLEEGSRVAIVGGGVDR
jgi:RND family efflux transporter MFP subunit